MQVGGSVNCFLYIETIFLDFALYLIFYPLFLFLRYISRSNKLRSFGVALTWVKYKKEVGHTLFSSKVNISEREKQIGKLKV